MPAGQGASLPGVPLSSARQRVRSGGRHEALRHPVLDVLEAVVAPSLVRNDVEERAAVELHVGEVLEEDVHRVDGQALELLAR